MRRAFTLIEILVVVAIIALLVAVLLPALSHARDTARSAKCLANMRDMGTGVNTFANGHKGRFQLVTGAAADPAPYGPVGPNADPSRNIYAYESQVGKASPGSGPALLAWPVVLLREAGTRGLTTNAGWGIEADVMGAYQAKDRMRRFDLMTCPSDKLAVGTPWWPLTPSMRGSLRWYGRLSYGLNEDIAGDVTDNDKPVWKSGAKGGGSGGGDRLLGKIDRILRPSEVVMLLDMGADKPPMSAADATANTIISKEARGPLLEFAEARWGRLPAERHRGGSLNITYADGHGNFVKKLNDTKYAGISGLPDFAYQPKSRVSHYAAGVFPSK